MPARIAHRRPILGRIGPATTVPASPPLPYPRPFTDNGAMTTHSPTRGELYEIVRQSWTIDEAALDRIEIGAGILGTGGGGNPYIGKLMARSLLRQGKSITVVAPASVPDDALVTSVGGMGSPTIGIERLAQGDEYLLALRTLEKRLGRPVTHLIPGEIGGANSTRPLVVAAQSGLPVIDGDGMGRAFPELQMDTFSIYGPSPTPAAIADPYGQTALFEGIADPRTLERYARAVTIQMGGAAGYAFPPMSGAEVKRTVIPHTMTLIHALGDAVLRARAEHRDAIASLLEITGGVRIFSGKITDVSRRLLGGFARGLVVIDGTGDHAGETLRIDFQNEYLIAQTGSGRVLSVAPDLICMVAAETADPITTEVLRYGLRVEAVAIPAPELLKTPEALAVVGPAAFGYPEVEFVPLPGTYASGLSAVVEAAR